MAKRISLALLAVTLLLTSTLAAQTTEASNNPEERGTRSIAVAVDAAPSIGYWFRAGERTDLGLDVILEGLFSDRTRVLSVGATPALKRYLETEGTLAQYLIFGVPLQYRRQEHESVGGDDATDDVYQVGGLFGFGLEWSPVRQVSVGGHVGLRADYISRDSADNHLAVRTHSSGLRVHLYF